jgi:hypothetical protein
MSAVWMIKSLAPALVVSCVFLALFLRLGAAQDQPCSEVSIVTDSKLQCTVDLGDWGNESNCVATGTEMILGVHYLSVVYLDTSAEGFGRGHIADLNGDYIADLSLIYVPSSYPYRWTAYYYNFAPNCSDAYDFNMYVTCL